MKTNRSTLSTALVILAALRFASAAADRDFGSANWPQFRGPGGRGISLCTNLPERWSASDNIAWKTDIPGRGWASPIAWGERVFLVTALSSDAVEPAKKGLYFGGERRDAPRAEHEWKILCLDLSSG